MRMFTLLCCIAALVALSLSLTGCGFVLSKVKEQLAKQPATTTTTASGEQTASGSETTGAETGGEETSASTSGETASEETSEPQETKTVYGKLPQKKASSSGGGGVKYVPVGAQRTLTTGDLQGLSKWDLDVLRNEIYAAHGRRFDRSDLQRYFEKQTWYTPDSGYNDGRLSKLESRNAAFIANYQKSRGQVSSGGSGKRRTTSGGGGSSSGQILPFSSSRRVEYGDLAGMTDRQLELARNEIYARHGRPFKRADLRSYFRSKSWYSEDSSFTESRLSSLEKRNAQTILNFEKMQ